MRPFRKMLDRSCVTPLCLGYNRQHMQICAKKIFGVRKVLVLLKNICLGALSGNLQHLQLWQLVFPQCPSS